MAFWRAALGAVLFGAQALLMQKVRLERADAWAVLGFGLVGISLFYGAYRAAIGSGGAALAAVLLYTAPAIVALFSWLFLREPMDAHKVGAVGLTLLGVALVSLQGAGQGHAGRGVLGPALGPDLCHLLPVWQALPEQVRHPHGVFVRAAGGGFGAAAVCAFCAQKRRGLDGHRLSDGGLHLLAVTLYFAGLRRLEATRASVVATIEPVVAALAAWLWWGERFSLLGYLGAGLVLAGVVWMVLRPQTGAAPIRPIARPERPRGL